MVEKYFFNPDGDLKFPTFSHGSQNGSAFVNFMLFFSNTMIFLKENRRSDHHN